MRSPSLVKDLCLAMRDGAGDATPITVKCRIGVDNDDSYEQLAAFVEEVGVHRLLSVGVSCHHRVSAFMNLEACAARFVYYDVTLVYIPLQFIYSVNAACTLDWLDQGL